LRHFIYCYSIIALVIYHYKTIEILSAITHI